MRVLGNEISCEEAAAAVVDEGLSVRAAAVRCGGGRGRRPERASGGGRAVDERAAVMRVLGNEISCEEAAAAVVDDGGSERAAAVRRLMNEPR
jgi:tRNA A37 threonylcarbamoyltransferase TsaD